MACLVLLCNLKPTLNLMKLSFFRWSETLRFLTLTVSKARATTYERLRIHSKNAVTLNYASFIYIINLATVLNPFNYALKMS